MMVASSSEQHEQGDTHANQSMNRSPRWRLRSILSTHLAYGSNGAGWRKKSCARDWSAVFTVNLARQPRRHRGPP